MKDTQSIDLTSIYNSNKFQQFLKTAYWREFDHTDGLSWRAFKKTPTPVQLAYIPPSKMFDPNRPAKLSAGLWDFPQQNRVLLVAWKKTPKRGDLLADLACWLGCQKICFVNAQDKIVISDLFKNLAEDKFVFDCSENKKLAAQCASAVTLLRCFLHQGLGVGHRNLNPHIYK